jgi:hypothetical protein
MLSIEHLSVLANPGADAVQLCFSNIAIADAVPCYARNASIPTRSQSAQNRGAPEQRRGVMGTHRGEKKVPTSVKVAIPAVLFAIAIFAGLVVIATRELPACARPAAVEKRFATQLEHMRGLLVNHGPDITPPEVTADEKESSGEPSAGTRAIDIPTLPHEDMWWLGIDIDKKLFDDPVILGASIRFFRKNCVTAITVKDFDEPGNGWTLSLRIPAVDRPVVTLYSAGKKRWIRYENRFEGPGGMQRGCRLYLDLDLLEKAGGFHGQK